MDADLRRAVEEKCRALGIPLVGFAPAERWETAPFEPWVPEAFRPAAIFPGTRTAIVIGLPVLLPIIDTAPSIWYHEHYGTLNALLDQYAYRIAADLNEQGYPAVPIPRDGYGSIGVLLRRPIAFFSHRHAAYLAGLGTFGVNNTLLTRAYGPRVRFATVLTTAEMPPDPVMTEPLCTRCMQCVEACPVGALKPLDYPDGLTDKGACAARSEALYRLHISPCGLCVQVCPIGEDRRHYHREDPGIYDEADERFARDHRAWTHVRSYGGA